MDASAGMFAVLVGVNREAGVELMERIAVAREADEEEARGCVTAAAAVLLNTRVA